MLRRTLSIALTVGIALSSVPTASAAGAAVGQISGMAMSDTGQHLSGQLARLRNLDSAHIAGVTTTSASGTFSFTGLRTGSYIVELVSNGYIVGTSALVVLTDRDTIVDGVPVTISTKSPEFLSFLGVGGFWATTGGFIVSTAVVAGIVTGVLIAARDDASPSR